MSTTTAPQRDPRRWRERGAAGVEHVGVIVAVAALVGIMITAMTPLGSTIATKYCEAMVPLGVELGCDEVALAGPEGEEGPTDDDLRPPACMYFEESTQASSSVTIGFIKIGNDTGFVIQQFSDGKVRVTVTDGASIGATVSTPGADVDIADLNTDIIDKKVEFGAGLEFGYGDTWVFENMDEWEELEGQLNDYLIQQQQMRYNPEGAAFAMKVNGVAEAPKDPAVTMSRIGLDVMLEGSAGVQSSTGELGEDFKPEFVDPNIGVSLSASAGADVIRRTNNETGEISETVEVSGSLDGQVDAAVAGGSVDGSVDGAFTVTRDADGNVTELVFQSTFEGGYDYYIGNEGTFPEGGGAVSEGESTSTVTETRLKVNDSNRDLVDAWLNERNAYGNALQIPFGAFVPEEPSDDPFMQLLYEEATTSNIQYHNVSDSVGFNLNLRAGWKFGIGLNLEQSTAEAVDAQFLGAPGPDGRRTMIPDETCVS